MHDESFDAEKSVALLTRVAGSLFTDAEIMHFAEAMRLTDTSELRAGLAEGILFCLAWSITAPHKRYSQIRREVQRVQKTAKSAADKLRDLSTALADLSEAHAESLLKLWDPKGEVKPNAVLSLADGFDVLSRCAECYADALKERDKGGPQKMMGFRMLIERLVKAVERASGSTPTLTYKPALYAWEGPFIDLVKVVLDKLSSLADDVSVASERAFGKTFKLRLKQPGSEGALGKYVQDIIHPPKPRRKRSAHLPRT